MSAAIAADGTKERREATRRSSIPLQAGVHETLNGLLERVGGGGGAR